MSKAARPGNLNRSERLRSAWQRVRAGDFAGGAAAAKSLADTAPGDPDVLVCLASALLGLGRWDEARRAAERGLRTRPDDTNLMFQVGMARIREGAFEDAHRILDRALALRPRDPLLTATKADALITQGQYDDAFALADRVWDSNATHPGLAISLSRAAARVGRAERGIAALNQSLASPDVSPAAQVDVRYTLAEVLDGTGRFDEAFDAVSQATGGRGRGDPEAMSRAIDCLIAAWTPEVIGRVPKRPRTDRPVFVLGFWRSGTTLVEQILSSHPSVAGGGELPFVARWVHEHGGAGQGGSEPMLTDPSRLGRTEIDRFARDYQIVLSGISATALRITDKAPGNFLHLGLIASALQGARVVRCNRDPVDTCLSCLFNLRGRRSFTQDLYSLGRFHRDYERLMSHWKSVLSIPVMEVAYEGLVGDPEPATRELVGFVGLPWDDACLSPQKNRRATQTRSMDQVRRPMYRSSVGRASNYERHLGPLRLGLDDGAKRVPTVHPPPDDPLSRALGGLNFPPPGF